MKKFDVELDKILLGEFCAWSEEFRREMKKSHELRLLKALSNKVFHA